MHRHPCRRHFQVRLVRCLNLPAPIQTSNADCNQSCLGSFQRSCRSCFPRRAQTTIHRSKNHPRRSCPQSGCLAKIQQSSASLRKAGASFDCYRQGFRPLGHRKIKNVIPQFIFGADADEFITFGFPCASAHLMKHLRLLHLSNHVSTKSLPMLRFSYTDLYDFP